MLVRKEGELLLSRELLKDLIHGALEKEAPFRVMATGNSMSPIIRAGDIIVVSPLAGKKPNCGDIVAFVRPQTEAVIVHRIVKKDNRDYFIRGDSPPSAIEKVGADRLLGRVTLVERNGKSKRFGLGGERFIIGFFNRYAIFSALLRAAQRFYRLIIGSSPR